MNRMGGVSELYASTCQKERGWQGLVHRYVALCNRWREGEQSSVSWLLLGEEQVGWVTQGSRVGGSVG